jgi:hypothetical protein
VDKIFSTRLDEAFFDELSRLTRRLRIAKRRFIEEAIRLRTQQSGADDSDVWAETLGVWPGVRAPPPSSDAPGESRRSFWRHHARP